MLWKLIGFPKQMGVPVFISQVQIIALEQFVPCCAIFDEALKLNSSDGSQTCLEIYLAGLKCIYLFF